MVGNQRRRAFGLHGSDMAVFDTTPSVFPMPRRRLYTSSFNLKKVTRMFAAVDLGSNSFRLHIGEPAGGRIHIVRTARNPIRLAAGLDADNMLSEAAMRSAIHCLQEFRKILDEYQLDAMRVVATNTMRVAKNADLLLPLAENAIGYPIEIISGEEEGRLIYMGVARAIERHDERRLVIDIGGGSTEVIAGTGGDIGLVESFGIGTQPQTLAYFPDGRITAHNFDAAVTAARARFEDAASLYHAKGWDAAYGSSGTMRAISEVDRAQRHRRRHGVAAQPAGTARRSCSTWATSTHSCCRASSASACP